MRRRLRKSIAIVGMEASVVSRDFASNLTRRRFLSVAAASTVSLLSRPALSKTQHISWRGLVFGAEAQIQLAHPDEELARQVIERCTREIDRLENIFSLYRSQSTLVRLNRDGIVQNPETEFIELLATAIQISRETRGAFDISIQPLWMLFARHFSRPNADPAGPVNADIKYAHALVGYRQISLSTREILLQREGMALTLNGIAQGFITDRIKVLLWQNGFENVLVHLGETYGKGAKPDGRRWQVGIPDPDTPSSIFKIVPLNNRSLATSSASGYKFSGDGLHNHLFDPRTGRSPNRYKSVSVSAQSATIADGLSTAFTNMAIRNIWEIVAKRSGIRATLFGYDGKIIEL